MNRFVRDFCRSLSAVIFVSLFFSDFGLCGPPIGKMENKAERGSSPKSKTPGERSEQFLRAVRAIWKEPLKDYMSPSGEIPSCRFRVPKSIEWENDRTQHAYDEPLPETYQQWEWRNEIKIGDEVVGSIFLQFYRNNDDGLKKLPIPTERRLFEKGKKTMLIADNSGASPEWFTLSEDPIQKDEMNVSGEHTFWGPKYQCNILVALGCMRCEAGQAFKDLLFEIKKSIDLRKDK